MDNNNNNNTKENKKDSPREITRKEAIKKVGKYAAVTAGTMLVVLSPKASQAQSPTPTPGWGS